MLELRELLARIIEDSYPIAERWDAAQAADSYLAWLDSLPTLDREVT